MYTVTAKTYATLPDFPGHNVEWKPGQMREVHEDCIKFYLNNPSAWDVRDDATVRGIANSTGRIKSVQAGGYDQRLDVLNNCRSGITLFGPEIAYAAPATANGAQCTINSAAAQTINGETYFTVNATATGASTNWFEIQLNTIAAFAADSVVLEFVCDAPASIGYVAAYLGTSGYALFAHRTAQMGSVGSGTDPFRNLGRLAMTFVSADWTKSGYANATNVQQWVNAKIRVSVANGATINFRLRSIQAGVARSPGRIAVVADDGYRSFIRAGAPVLEQYGIPSTMAIISNQVGNTGGGFAALSDLQSYVERGNMCIAHGPLQNATNLFAAPYTDTASRIADMQTCRDYLLAQRLTDSWGAKCYVFPQGVYASAAGEADLLDAMQAAGFTLGRTAVAGTATPASRSQHIRALSARCHQRLTLPILGHTYQGAAATADDATETTNINTIVTAIQALSTNGSDGVLMLHKVVARGGATGGAGTIEIEQDRLATIAAAIKTEVDAGKLRAVTFPDMAIA